MTSPTPTTGPGAPGPGGRRPQQSRSRETVERILQAADREIGEHGLAQASTTGIARRAGVSIGGLYRFFRDKDAIAAALSQRYLEEVSGSYAQVLGTMNDGVDVAHAVLALVDVAAEAQVKHPGYYRLTEDRGPELADSPAHQVREGLIEMFVAQLRDGVSAEPEEHLRTVVELAIETVRHTLAHGPSEPAARERTVGELKAMLAAYLGSRFAAPQA